MRIWPATLLGTALAGCSTTIRELRADAPRAAYESHRSPAALEGCLAGNLSWLSQPSIVHGEASTELAFGGAGSTALLVTIRPAGTGSHVEVRELLGYGARIRHNVEACVSGKDA